MRGILFTNKFTEVINASIVVLLMHHFIIAGWLRFGCGRCESGWPERHAVAEQSSWLLLLLLLLLSLLLLPLLVEELLLKSHLFLKEAVLLLQTVHVDAHDWVVSVLRPVYVHSSESSFLADRIDMKGGATCTLWCDRHRSAWSLVRSDNRLSACGFGLVAY